MVDKNALIMVDLQNDFCEGGNLAVPNGDEVIPIANQLQKKFDLIIATKDWHPQDHMSFASNHPGYKIGDTINVDDMEQHLWPDHCVQNTKGAEFHPKLDTTRINKIIYKGTDKTIDSYSAFYDNAHLRSTGLGEFLKEQGIKEVYILGLATDYCVKFSCLDALTLGFKVSVIEDACRGVEINIGDTANALSEMKRARAKLLSSKTLRC